MLPVQGLKVLICDGLFGSASAYARGGLLICDGTINAKKGDIQNVEQHIWCYLEVFLGASLLIPS